MNSIEMTDIDGDALTLLTHENRTWVTCTSGAEEVTVGPFPTHLVHRLLSRVADSEQTSPLVSLSFPAQPDETPDDQAGDRTWEEFAGRAQSPSPRTAADGAVEAALCALDEAAREDPELAAQFRQVAVTFGGTDAQADHPVSLGDREG